MYTFVALEHLIIVKTNQNGVESWPKRRQRKLRRRKRSGSRQLTAEQYHVTREAGTECAFTGKYWNTKDAGDVSLRVLRHAAV